MTGPERQGHPLLAAVLTVGLTAAGVAEAQETERPAEGLPAAVSEEILFLKEETVTIASRYEQPISEAASNVYVITDEDIRLSGATDLPTILRRIPGMEVMQTTGAEFDVSVRGDNQLVANKLLVMVDGRSIYIDAQGTVFWKLLPVTLPEIKRIEVLKGPASAVYGFNAFDGIINIITKSPEESKGTTLQVGAGELGTITSAAVHGGKTGNLGYRFSAGWDQNQQWRNRDSLAMRAYKVNAQTEYQLHGEAKIQLAGGLVESNRFDGPVQATSITPTAPTLAYTDLAYVRPNFLLRAWWNMTNTAGSIQTNDLLAGFIQSTDRSFTPISIFRGNTYNIESHYSHDIGSANRLTVGLNYRHNALSFNINSEFSREDRLGFYLQSEWRATETITALTGVRYDLDTFINPTISPRVALIYKATPGHTFRATLSVAYRPPTLLESKVDFFVLTTLPPPTPSPPPTRVTGSPDLDPEQIISYEIGYQGWFLRHRLRVRTDLFFNHVSDLINFRGGLPPRNGGEADIYGGEAGAEVLATSWLSGFANFAYQEIGQTFTGDDRRGAPRFKWNVGLRAEWESGLSGEAAFHHYGSVTYPINQAFFLFSPIGGFTPPNPRVGSYNLLNLRGAYRFWHQKAAAGYMREAEVAVSAFNALNDKHKEHPLGDEIGSRVMGWVTLKF